MKYPKLRELKEAIKALVIGPYTSRFPFEPHEPPERFRGRPKFYERDCTGCTACVNVCPSGAITFEDKIDQGKAVRIFTLRYDICIFCGQCQANCLTEKGIMLSREFDLATTGKRTDLIETVEKELVICEDCKEIVGPKDQILWVAKKLGPLAFSNTTMMLFYLQNNSLARLEASPAEKGNFPNRSDRIKMLCPRCRREVVIKS
ncbi:MAG: 4Fe-4S dicluster domain-containing protein [Candidatus Omnitrophota bacterium]|nr:4Fe-4S dicluster domain-containing protein [Candidatus Omnitrophota bacterium]